MTYAVHLEQRAEQQATVVRGQMDVEEIGAFVGSAFGDVLEALGAQGTAPVGPPFARFGVHGDTFDVEAGFPTSAPVVPAGRVEPAVLPGGTVATTIHVGSYDRVSEAYEELFAWADAEGFVPVGEPWESYLDGPEVPEPRTVICLPCGPSDAPAQGDPRLPSPPTDG